MEPITYQDEELDITIDTEYLTYTHLGRVTRIPSRAIETAVLEQLSEDSFTLYVIGQGVPLTELIITGTLDKVMPFYEQVQKLSIT